MYKKSCILFKPQFQLHILSSDSGGRGGSTSTGNSGGARGSDGRGRLSDGGSTGDHGWAGDSVGKRVVDVNEDTGVGRRIQLGGDNTRRGLGATTSDTQVEALHVVLRAVLGMSAMESDHFMAKNIVTGGDIGRDLHEPGVIVLNELVVSPEAGDFGVIDKPDPGNLEELEGGLVDGRATGVVATGGEVVDHRSVMGLRPFGPLEVDAVTGGDCREALRVGSVDVTDHVVGGEEVRFDEAVGRVGGTPGDYGGRLSHVGERVDIPALEGNAVDDDIGDMPVAGDVVGQEGEQGGFGETIHAGNGPGSCSW